MAYIGKQPTVGNFQVCDAITVVNGQAAYTLQVSSANVEPENANHMLVSLNGVLQKPGSSFTISGATITFASNLATGDVIDFIILLGNVLDIGSPSDGTVTNAKLAQDIISAETALTAEPADTDEFLVSDAGTLKRIDYSLIKGGGKIAQVVQATKTDTATVANASFTDMSGLTLNITPSASSSKVLAIFNLNMSTANGQRGGIKLVRGSTDLLIGDAASNRNRTSHMMMSTSGAHSLHVPLVYLDSPSTTSATTYKIQAFCESGNNIHVNRTDSDTDNDTYSRSASSLVLMEVLA